VETIAEEVKEGLAQSSCSNALCILGWLECFVPLLVVMPQISQFTCCLRITLSKPANIVCAVSVNFIAALMIMVNVNYTVTP